MTKYQTRRDRRSEARHLGGRFKAGLLAPVMAHKIMGSEAALLSQNAHFELDHVPGRLMSPIRGEVISVFVPLAAIHALKNPTADYPGSTDVIRHELAQGNAITALETENEITKRCGVNPVSVAGVKKVDESVRLAYIAAQNFLRQRRYVNATVLDKNSTAMGPAILTQTVLDRLNGVLDPEDRVNGAVAINASLPVKGLGFAGVATAETGTFKETGGTSVASDTPLIKSDVHQYRMGLEDRSTGGGPDFYPNITAELGTNISLTDFFQAEQMDRITREMRAFVDQNPEHGEEIVTRWAMGLSLDIGREPFVLFERQIELNAAVVRAMDGPNLDTVKTFPSSSINFTVPVPATEFGGVVITMMSVKPDEVLDSQPHPLLTKAWAADNFVADELAVDPEPVAMRELYSDVDVGDEDVTAMYIGHHGLRRNYQQYGWNRHLDTADVAAQTSIWQLAVPMSVTPNSVLYPASLPQTPFADTLAEVCTYGIQSAIMVQTPTIFGPSPVEELAAIEDADVFEDA